MAHWLLGRMLVRVPKPEETLVKIIQAVHGGGDLSLGSKLRFFDFTKTLDPAPMRWTSLCIGYTTFALYRIFPVCCSRSRRCKLTENTPTIESYEDLLARKTFALG